MQRVDHKLSFKRKQFNNLFWESINFAIIYLEKLMNENYFFADLMLAQAQEMVVLKAIRDKMKDQIVAKLCVSCEELVRFF